MWVPHSTERELRLENKEGNPKDHTASVETDPPDVAGQVDVVENKNKRARLGTRAPQVLSTFPGSNQFASPILVEAAKTLFTSMAILLDIGS